MDGVEAASVADFDIFACFTSLLADRRRRPPDELVGVLTTAVVDDGRLTDEDAAELSQPAGRGERDDPPRRGASCWVLLEDPDQMWSLHSTHALLPSAVEGILRWISLGLYILRTAKVDTRVGAKS